MARELTTLVIILVILAITEISAAIIDDNDEIPLSKSLGYAIKSSLNKNVEDMRLGRQYEELYQEMVRASRESFERVDDEVSQLEEVIGRKRAEMVKKGVIVRRRSVARLSSPLGRRRVRSQASRREKLELQGLQSHRNHIRKHRLSAQNPSPRPDVDVKPHYNYLDDYSS